MIGMLISDLPGRILIIGSPSRPLVQSALRGGYRVGAIDHYADFDLCSMVDELIRVQSPLDAFTIGQELVDKGEYECMVAGGWLGVENSMLNHVRDFELPYNIPYKYAERIVDKKNLQKTLKKMNIPHPREFREENVEYPAVVKPRVGAGGKDVVVVRNDNELSLSLERFEKNEVDYIIQEYVEGRDASVSLIVSKEEAKIVALNEQLIGTDFLHAHNMEYSGNVTPLEQCVPTTALSTIERMCIDMGLLGSCGVDIVVGNEKWWVIEVNPRFQGSIDTIDLSLDISLFDWHMKSFHNLHLPECSYNSVWARGIYYSPVNIRISSSLSEKLKRMWKKGVVRDVPQEGEIYSEGDPFMSIVVKGRKRDETIVKLREVASQVDEMLKRKFEKL